MLTTTERRLLAMYMGAAGKEATKEEIIKTISEGSRIIEDPMLMEEVQRLKDKLENMSDEELNDLVLPEIEDAPGIELELEWVFPEGLDVKILTKEHKKRMSLYMGGLSYARYRSNAEEDE